MISNLRHRVILCRQSDVVSDAGNLILNREAITEMWASIEVKKASTYSPQGAAVMDNRNGVTHIVCVRYRTDLNISMFGWLYEQRLQSSPRWFKILSVSETEGKGSKFFKFDCRIIERSDDLVEPKDIDRKGPVVGLPKGVQI